MRIGYVLERDKKKGAEFSGQGNTDGVYEKRFETAV